MGSVATVIAGETGFEVYMANSQKEWVNLGSVGESENGGSQEEQQQNNKIILGPMTWHAGNDLSYYQKDIVIENNIITGATHVFYDEYASLYLDTTPQWWYSSYGGTNVTKIAIIEGETVGHEILLKVGSEYGLATNAISVTIPFYINYNDNTQYLFPKYLHIFDITPQEAELLQEDTYNDTITNTIFSAKTPLETYDISQLEYIDSEDWEQAGE